MVQRDAAYERLRVSDRPYLPYVYCGSFNNAVNKSNYIASSAWMMCGVNGR